MGGKKQYVSFPRERKAKFLASFAYSDLSVAFEFEFLFLTNG